MKHDQLHHDLATIGRNGIDRIIALEREIEDMRICLRNAASTIKFVTNHHEAGVALPEWVIQDFRVALAHIGAQIRENVL